MTGKKFTTALLLAAILSGCASTDIPAHRETTLPPAQTLETQGQEREPEVLSDGLPLPVNPRNTDFVRVKDLVPDIFVELKYATEDNFTGKAIYSFPDAYLRYGTACRLAAVNGELEELGLRLKIWDGFRPVSAQFALWEAYPDPQYVADPNRGFGSHTRGNTVDITLTDLQGREVEMPTGFDDFSAKADRDYSDCTPEAAENAMLLERIMEKHGFSGYWGEWWHYTDVDDYDVETVFDPALISCRYADCQEYLTLRICPDVGAEEILRIPADARVILLGYEEGFAMVDYWGYRGYVLAEYLRQTP